MFEIPDCAITLYFYEEKPETEGSPATPPRFSYYCTHRARGWHVELDGSIHPPARTRIVQIGLSGFPEDCGASFGGLQFSSTGFPEEDDIWSSSQALASFGVEVATPGDYPPASGSTAGPLRLTFDSAPRRLFYRLAVRDRNGLHWDDPKIYDDGSQ